MRSIAGAQAAAANADVEGAAGSVYVAHLLTKRNGATAMTSQVGALGVLIDGREGTEPRARRWSRRGTAPPTVVEEDNIETSAVELPPPHLAFRGVAP